MGIYAGSTVDNLTIYELMPGLHDLILKKNALLVVTPVKEVAGNAYKYNRASTEPSGAHPSATDGSLTSTMPTSTLQTAYYEEFAYTGTILTRDKTKFATHEDAEARATEDGTFGAINSATKEMAWGAGTGQQILGIENMIVSGSANDVDLDGKSLTVSRLFQVYQKVPQELGQKFFVANERVEAQLIGLLDGKNQPSEWSPIIAQGTTPALIFFGTPVLILETLRNFTSPNTTENPTGGYTNIFCLAVGERGYHFITPVQEPWLQYGEFKQHPTNYSWLKKCKLNLGTVLINTKAIARGRGIVVTGY